LANNALVNQPLVSMAYVLRDELKKNLQQS